MIDHGGRCQNAQNVIIIKPYSELILYKPACKYQFTMACISALVMIAYQVINCLISQQKHIFWVLKRNVAMKQFFYAPYYRFNLMSK